MATLYKEGVCGDLTREAYNAKRVIERMAGSHGEDLIITSKRDGAHSDGSLHPQGDAFDFRPLKTVTIADIHKALGLDYDIINESNHWHAEYDPKAKK